MKKVHLMLVGLLLCPQLLPQYSPVAHRYLTPGEIPVSSPGSYAGDGRRFVLVNDISAEGSALFLGNNVTLDLNGYTLRYAAGGYEHIPNSGFEEGSSGWDLSKAPGAEIRNTEEVHVFMGSKLMSLQPGDEIVSQYVNLPVAGRSYFAMCGITGRYYHDMKKYPDDEMKVSIFVEDAQGRNVVCSTKYGDGTRISCPVEKKSPRLGGGFVFAHLHGLPAGKYRVRIKADTDCLVDEIDIRPAMDAGISIIGNTTPLAHYDHIIAESYPPVTPAFYDFTGDFERNLPLPSLPHISGSGVITIKNGIIEAGTPGIQSWGIQSSAPDVMVVLENVKIVTAGISCGSADILQTKIKNCRFEADVPFLIQRHVNHCSVLIRGTNPSEVSNSEFFGGQGCLSVTGKYSVVHDNLFVNDQWVTNHYSIMGTGDSSKIFNNRFEPKQGSGIYVSRYTEVFNNLFKIETSKPTCEYGREEYSTAAIRLGDYNAAPGSRNASAGNRIHDNRIFITARDFGPAEYIPMCWGIYYSASGGENYVYDNEFAVEKTDPSSRVITAALYICGGPRYYGGQFYGNVIRTNVPAAWIASMYGGAANSDIYCNTVIATGNDPFKTFRMGSSGCDDCVAKLIKFRSNFVRGQEFGIDATDQDHSFTVYWTLNAVLMDKPGRPGKNRDVTIFDNTGKIAVQGKTNNQGKFSAELPEYQANGKDRIFFTPYTIVSGSSSITTDLNRNTDVILTY
ncbi:MAG: hypothetical protein GT598_06140 [Bacteroidales bacterium]|nr:hypothetical protein [Bacteroidales bacterium]HPM17887.1 hypothetical protein [Bacteroidales bacterium]